MTAVASPVCGFTERQIEVIRLIAAGLSDKEIGPALGISHGCALQHVLVIRRNLGGALRRQVPLAFYTATGIDPWPRLTHRRPRLQVVEVPSS